MPNYHPKTSQLPKQKASWNNLPTKAIRVPEIFLEEIMEYAQVRDRFDSGFEIIINLLDTLTDDELRQLRKAVDSLNSLVVKDDNNQQEIQ